MRKAIPVEQRVAVTLWRLATTADYQTIVHLVGISKAAVCIIGAATKICSLKEVIHGLNTSGGFHNVLVQWMILTF